MFGFGKKKLYKVGYHIHKIFIGKRLTKCPYCKEKSYMRRIK